ncbi:hypothetical protein TUBRATIS_28830 [Tubulinosema ratisbonensis]|uniref:Uncharacterized protein n=1 Tax=Tubulinosema ratisbonensis TaxID=291195 RepID=A0A437AHQ3_9MICR|nr:hypothetical protein TUBRATIS_28830 [Tubulinosema ratisbonensis]
MKLIMYFIIEIICPKRKEIKGLDEAAKKIKLSEQELENSFNLSVYPKQTLIDCVNGIETNLQDEIFPFFQVNLILLNNEALDDLFDILSRLDYENYNHLYSSEKIENEITTIDENNQTINANEELCVNFSCKVSEKSNQRSESIHIDSELLSENEKNSPQQDIETTDLKYVMENSHNKHVQDEIKTTNLCELISDRNRISCRGVNNSVQNLSNNTFLASEQEENVPVNLNCNKTNDPNLVKLDNGNLSANKKLVEISKSRLEDLDLDNQDVTVKLIKNSTATENNSEQKFFRSAFKKTDFSDKSRKNTPDFVNLNNDNKTAKIKLKEMLIKKLKSKLEDPNLRKKDDIKEIIENVVPLGDISKRKFFRPSFSDNDRLNENAEINIKLYSNIKIIKEINYLEEKTFIVFNEYYHHLCGLKFPVEIFNKNFNTSSAEYVEGIDEIKNFFYKYIINMPMLRSIASLNKSISQNVGVTLEFLINQFNQIFIKYVENIQKVIFSCKKEYLKKIEREYTDNNKHIKIKNLRSIYDSFLMQKENSILLILFPELKKFIFEHKKKINKVEAFKTLHIFLTMLATKFHFLKDNFRSLFLKLEQNPSWHIFQSNFISYFIFEMKCTIIFFSFYFIQKINFSRKLLLRTFIIFLKLLDLENLKKAYFYRNIFDPTGDCKKYFENIELLTLPIFNQQHIKIFDFFKIKSISYPHIRKYFDFCKNDLNKNIDEENYLKKEKNLLKSSYSKNPYLAKLKYITQKLKNYLFQLD